MEDKKIISLEMPISLANMLKDVALKKEMSISALIRLIIKEYLGR